MRKLLLLGVMVAFLLGSGLAKAGWYENFESGLGVWNESGYLDGGSDLSTAQSLSPTHSLRMFYGDEANRNLSIPYNNSWLNFSLYYFQNEGNSNDFFDVTCVNYGNGFAGYIESDNNWTFYDMNDYDTFETPFKAQNETWQNLTFFIDGNYTVFIGIDGDLVEWAHESSLINCENPFIALFGAMDNGENYFDNVNWNYTPTPPTPPCYNGGVVFLPKLDEKRDYLLTTLPEFCASNITNSTDYYDFSVSWNNLVDVPLIVNGTNGLNGLNGTNGTNGAPGSPGAPGANGMNGTNGTDGLNATNDTSFWLFSVDYNSLINKPYYINDTFNVTYDSWLTWIYNKSNPMEFYNVTTLPYVVNVTKFVSSVNATTKTCTGTEKFKAYDAATGVFTCGVDDNSHGADEFLSNINISSVTNTGTTLLQSVNNATGVWTSVHMQNGTINTTAQMFAACNNQTFALISEPLLAANISQFNNTWSQAGINFTKSNTMGFYNSSTVLNNLSNSTLLTFNASYDTWLTNYSAYKPFTSYWNNTNALIRNGNISNAAINNSQLQNDIINNTMIKNGVINSTQIASTFMLSVSNITKPSNCSANQVVNGFTDSGLYCVADQTGSSSSSTKATIISRVEASKTMTNIGTSSVSIYGIIFGPETTQLMNFSGYTQFRIIFDWDYIGSGTQMLIWRNISAQNTILYNISLTADAAGWSSTYGDTGWINIPAIYSNTAEHQIILYGNSSTAGDDPVSYGYTIYGR